MLSGDETIARVMSGLVTNFFQGRDGSKSRSVGSAWKAEEVSARWTESISAN
jgi:hypothetical protein